MGASGKFQSYSKNGPIRKTSVRKGHKMIVLCEYGGHKYLILNHFMEGCNSKPWKAITDITGGLSTFLLSRGIVHGKKRVN